MKKSLLFLAITFGIQLVSAHPGGASHTHDSFLNEWSWVLLPALAVMGLIYYVNKKNYNSSRR